MPHTHSLMEHLRINLHCLNTFVGYDQVDQVKVGVHRELVPGFKKVIIKSLGHSKLNITCKNKQTNE